MINHRIKKRHTQRRYHFLAHRHHPYLRPISFHREIFLTRIRRISHWGEGQLPGYNFSYRPSAPSEIFFKTSSRYQKILRSIEIASLLRRRLNKWKKNHFFSCVFIIAFLKKKNKIFFLSIAIIFFATEELEEIFAKISWWVGARKSLCAGGILNTV